jgi:hypothetical protein
MSETKLCIACSEDIKSSARLCKNCNTRQDDKSFESPEGDEDFDPVAHWSQGNAKSRGDSTKKSGFIYAAVLLGTVAIVGVYLSYMGSFSSSTSQSNQTGSEETNTSSEAVAVQPHEAYYLAQPADARKWMKFSLDALNYFDENGKWQEDQFQSSSPLVVGVLLDNYSTFPAGCSVWFFENEDDAEIASDDGTITVPSSENWLYWSNQAGHTIFAVTDSFDDECWKSIMFVLEPPV